MLPPVFLASVNLEITGWSTLPNHEKMIYDRNIVTGNIVLTTDNILA